MGWNNRFLIDFNSGGGGNDSKIMSLEDRKAEFKWQAAEAEKNRAHSRKMVLEDREYAEDMAKRKAVVAQKEEAARLAELESQQRTVSDEAEGIADAPDRDQEYASGSNMWASLVTGTTTPSGRRPSGRAI